MKKIVASFVIFVCLFCLFCIGSSHAANTTGEIISNETKSKLVEIKDTELKSIEYFK